VKITNENEGVKKSLFSFFFAHHSGFQAIRVLVNFRFVWSFSLRSTLPHTPSTKKNQKIVTKRMLIPENVPFIRQIGEIILNLVTN